MIPEYPFSLRIAGIPISIGIPAIHKYLLVFLSLKGLQEYQPIQEPKPDNHPPTLKINIVFRSIVQPPQR